ncbi:hypothetical protein [Cecembia rubra]|uniref:hypothetical protein n=1 Tax=Cecembia rubra TaxID=1485585 RepID=UPI0039C8CBB5
MGSDFSNDNLVKESSLVEDYNHSLSRTENTEIMIIISSTGHFFWHFRNCL